MGIYYDYAHPRGRCWYALPRRDTDAPVDTITYAAHGHSWLTMADARETTLPPGLYVVYDLVPGCSTLSSDGGVSAFEQWLRRGCMEVFVDGAVRAANDDPDLDL